MKKLLQMNKDMFDRYLCVDCGDISFGSWNCLQCGSYNLATNYQLTLADVKLKLKVHRITITWKPATGEYRVNFQHGQEGTAYYTNDLQDALDTGIAMRATGGIFEDPDPWIDRSRSNMWLMRLRSPWVCSWVLVFASALKSFGPSVGSFTRVQGKSSEDKSNEKLSAHCRYSRRLVGFIVCLQR
jgi:hypothetical protein